MGNNIGWCDVTINPLRAWYAGRRGYHCTKTSDGCKNCYAQRYNHRFGNKHPFDRHSDDIKFELDLSVFDKLPKKKPKRVFVQSMGDLFHPGVHSRIIDLIWERMEKLSHHTFIVLTKRPNLIESKLSDGSLKENPLTYNWLHKDPLPNVWPGVSCENQEMYDKRVPVLMSIPAAKHIVSLEPLLGPIDLCLDIYRKDRPHPEWIIAGEETGPGKRPCNIEWVRSIRDQCVAADVPFYLKKINGDRILDCRTWNMIPGEKL